MTIPQTKFFDTVKKEWLPTKDIVMLNDKIFRISLLEEGVDLDNPKTDETGLFRLAIFYDPNIIAVPFTGKFDKNIRPIYKHDILKETHLSMLIRDEKQIGEVLWNENRCRFQLTNRVIDLSEWDTCEIIGSSLTNPELLNEYKK